MADNVRKERKNRFKWAVRLERRLYLYHYSLSLADYFVLYLEFQKSKKKRQRSVSRDHGIIYTIWKQESNITCVFLQLRPDKLTMYEHNHVQSNLYKRPSVSGHPL